MKIKLIGIFMSVLFFSCRQQEKKAEINEGAGAEKREVKTSPQINYLKLIQGPWQDSLDVYYVDGENYRIFEFRKFYSHKFELNGNEISYFAMRDRMETYKCLVTRITKDSLIIRSGRGTRKFWRPAKETLQKDTISLDVIKVNEKKILTNTFVFSLLSDYEEHIFLQVHLKDCKDSCVRLVHDFSYRWGNCNATINGEAVYEINNGYLIIYSEVEDIEHMDDRYPHSTTEYIKETYAFRKTGDIVRMKIEKGNKNPDLVKEVQNKLAELKWKKS